MGNPNWETKKFAKNANNAKEMWDEIGQGGQSKQVCGDSNDPRMFFDKDGYLHIIIDKVDWENKVKNYRVFKKGEGEHNEDKGVREGEGIYVHVISSPPMNKVCPCKLDPNADCPSTP